MPENLFYNQPKNNSIFVYTDSKLPPGSKSLLGLGLKFCVKTKHPTNKLEDTIKRFEKDIRTKDWLRREQPEDDETFNPKIYLRNPMWEPPDAVDEVEEALVNFKDRLTQEQAKYQALRSRPNLTPLQTSAMTALKDNNRFIVIPADKNMGVTIFEREKFIKQVIKEHLGNQNVYENITDQIQLTIHGLKHFYNKFIENYGSRLPKNVFTFLVRSRDIHGDRIAVFRATAKVHKNPVTLRPVVAKCGTTIEALSKWVDVEIQKTICALPQCIKDSATFRAEVINLQLPPGARLVTCDAVSMYSHTYRALGAYLPQYHPITIIKFLKVYY